MTLFLYDTIRQQSLTWTH